MSSKFLRADFNFALPSAEIAVMGPQGAVSILYGGELAKHPEPEKRRAELTKELEEKFSSPYQAAKAGSIDAVIEPSRARETLIWAFETLRKKRNPASFDGKGNIPI
jgi:acetyl-CoA carboxylase carboxyltransferase component